MVKGRRPEHGGQLLQCAPTMRACVRARDEDSHSMTHLSVVMKRKQFR